MTRPLPRRGTGSLAHEAVPLLWRLAAGAACALAVVGISRLLGAVIPAAIPVAVGLAVGGLWWLVSVGADRDVPPDPPALDLDADFALPHAQDIRVRRLEDLVHGAQPSRRMTARGLGRLLGEIAEERALRPDAPPLSTELRRFVEASRQPDGESRPVGPVDRRTLHRYLRELAATGEERDR